MTTLNTLNHYSLMTPAKATELAAKMQADDPDWQYVVVHDPKGTGLSFIEAYNEDGEYVGRI